MTGTVLLDNVRVVAKEIQIHGLNTKMKFIMCFPQQPCFCDIW